MKAGISDEKTSFTIAIVGGGFSGTILASELLRQGDAAITVALIEREGCPGRGVAYGTHATEHLLNVNTQNMSARVDDPQHFLRWARENYSDQVQPGDFLPRRVYGKYVESTLCDAIEENPGRFEWRRDEVLSITRANGRARLSLRNGSAILADAVVLALGNFPPNELNLTGLSQNSQRYVANPWAIGALEKSSPEDSVLLVGSGLTSVDAAISLRAHGFRGKVHMLSRHGLLPQAHKTTTPRHLRWDHAPIRRARDLVRLIRAEVAKAEKHGSDWCAVIDSIRPFAQSIWRSLPVEERRRFLRHVRVFWDVSRHRVAPEIGRFLETELSEGRLKIHAGRIADYRENGDAVEVCYQGRGQEKLTKLHVDSVINCTGPDGDCRRVNSPLLNALLNQQLVRPDPLCLGLDTNENGALLDAQGVPSKFLYTLGPLRKGNLWETTAVPEIRLQASELASHLVTQEEARSVDISLSEHAVA